jgi:hypothetical protein
LKDGGVARKKMEDMLEEAVKWWIFQKEYDWGMLLLLPADNDYFNHRQIHRLKKEELEVGMKWMHLFNPRMLGLSEKLKEYVAEFVEVGNISQLPKLKLETVSLDELNTKEGDLEEELGGEFDRYDLNVSSQF